MARRQITAAPKRSRGRPKGTGIDDAPVLASILALIADDRGLKPTTAIKRVGVTDPSAIRRLRDKLRDNSLDRHRIPAAALATPRPETVTAELPTGHSPTSPPELPERAPGPEAPASKHPPLAAETDKRTREALLLAAYLDAMAKSLPSNTSQASPEPKTSPAQSRPEPTLEASRQESQEADSKPPPRPVEPPQAEASRQADAPPRQAPFSFPGMPPFLQPFRPPQPPPSAGTSQGQQLEAMKLAVEAMTSMTKLQLHITENAFAYSPLALMLQGQAMVGQMLLASFTGQLDAMKPKKPTGTK